MGSILILRALAVAAWRVWLRARVRLARAVVFDGVVLRAVLFLRALVVLRADVLLRAVERRVLGLRAVLGEVVLVVVLVVSAMCVPPSGVRTGVPSYICSYTRGGGGLQRLGEFVAEARAAHVKRP